MEGHVQITIDKAYFDATTPDQGKLAVLEDAKKAGYQNHRELKSPVTDKQLPVHWHSTDIISYVLQGP